MIEKPLDYNGEEYCLLVDGRVEPLYYGQPYDEELPKEELKRNFYLDENDQWYLDHDVITNTAFEHRHSKIVAFGNSEEELENTK